MGFEAGLCVSLKPALWSLSPGAGGPVCGIMLPPRHTVLYGLSVLQTRRGRHAQRRPSLPSRHRRLGPREVGTLARSHTATVGRG